MFNCIGDRFLFFALRQKYLPKKPTIQWIETIPIKLYTISVGYASIVRKPNPKLKQTIYISPPTVIEQNAFNHAIDIVRKTHDIIVETMHGVPFHEH